MDRRINRYLELYIEAIINRLAEINLREAADALRVQCVPFETALRVLTRPARRRQVRTPDRRRKRR